MPNLLVVVFSLVLDRQYCQSIQLGLETIKGKVTAGAEIDYQFAQIIVILDRPAHHRCVPQRQKCFADDECGPVGGVDIFAGEKGVKAG